MQNQILALVNFVLHVDIHLNRLIAFAGSGTYAILFLIIFAETGLVIAPFLPGDSLLFTAGALAATGSLNIYALVIILILASIMGDSVNYSIGRRIGGRVYREERLLGIPMKRKHLDDARAFYTKHGTKAIALSRFLPILRTLVPFTAGVGNMPYQSFLVSNIVGGITWVSLFTIGGYFFGNIPAVKSNFGFVIIGIVVVSFMPIVFEVLRTKFKR